MFVAEAETSNLYNEHLERLKSICRLCGKRVTGGVEDRIVGVKQCIKCTKNILDSHNIDVNEDEQGRQLNQTWRH